MMVLMPPRRRRNPVLTRYQVEIKGRRYYVRVTKRGATVAGPFKGRIAAQRRADELERTMWGQ
jgi:hypothetical protein